MIDDEQLLREYCERFFGYGAWNAKIWFIGMEEGGKDSSSKSALNQRLDLWQNRKKQNLENAPEFYGCLPYSKQWFGECAKPQRTWRQLIRVMLIAQGYQATETEILNIQTTNWGTQKSLAAILEMFALPAQKASEWHYNSITSAWFLRSRGLYTHFFYRNRADYLSKQIQEQLPKLVIFYGKTYDFLWEGIARKKFEQTLIDGLITASVDKTRCFRMLHPTAWHGNDDAYFEKVGKYLSQFII